MSSLNPTLPNVVKGNWDSVINFNRVTQKYLKKLYTIQLGSEATPTFKSLTLTSLVASQLVYTDSDGILASLGAATNGQLAIGSSGTDPALATITEGTGITVTNGAGSITLDVDATALDHSELLNLDYASAGHTGFEPTVTKGDLTAGSTKITIGGTGTGALIGTGASVDVAEANLTHNNIGGLQGGTTNEYYHITSAQNTSFGNGISQTTANPGSITTSNGIVTAMSVNAYANVYAYETDTEITISDTGIANKVQITAFAANGPYEDATPDHTNDHITIATAGDYHITVSLTCLTPGAGGGAEYGFAVFKNNGDTVFQNLHANRTLAGGGGDSGSVSMSGIATLAASDTIEVWTWNYDNTDNIVIDDISLSLVKVGT